MEFPEPLAPGCATDAAAALAAALDLGWPVLSPPGRRPPAAVSCLGSAAASLVDALCDDSAAGSRAGLEGRGRDGRGGGSGGTVGTGGGARGALLYQRLRGDVNAVLLQAGRLDSVLAQLLQAAATRFIPDLWTQGPIISIEQKKSKREKKRLLICFFVLPHIRPHIVRKKNPLSLNRLPV